MNRKKTCQSIKAPRRQGDYLKQILFLALPIFLNGIVIQLHAVISRAFLGHLKTDFLTVIGNTTFPFYASIAIPLAITTGLTILIAQSLGAGNYHKVEEYTESSFMFNLLIALGIFALWKLFAKEVFWAMGIKDAAILYWCIEYLNVLILVLPVMAFEMTITAILQGIGITRPIMYAGVIKVVLSIGLDYGFIFGNLGLPKIGYLGAAWSLVMASLASTLFLVVFTLFKLKLPFAVRAREFVKFKWAPFQEILKVGIPSGFELFAWYVATLFRIQFINNTGKNDVAIFMIIYGIELFIFQSYDSLAKATTTLVGQKAGAGEEEETKAVVKSVNRINRWVIVTIILSNIVFARQILGIFTPDKTLIEASVIYLIVNTVTHYARSLNVIYGAGIRALGDTRWMFYTQLLGTAIIIGTSYGLMFTCRLGLLGAFLAALWDEFSRAFLNMTRFIKGKRFIFRWFNQPKVNEI